MAKEYLDKDGLAYFWTKIKAYIAQQGGGGLTIDDIYPVGSIYTSVNSTYPGTLFAGTTWVQIEDTFLLAAGSTYTAGDTGGNATHTHTTGSHKLTASESGMPSHGHADTFSVDEKSAISISSSGAHGHSARYRSVYNGNSNYSAVTVTGSTATSTGAIVDTSGSHTHSVPAHTHGLSGSVTDASGKSATSAHSHGDTGASSNMPPYLAVYVWKRTE